MGEKGWRTKSVFLAGVTALVGDGRVLPLQLGEGDAVKRVTAAAAAPLSPGRAAAASPSPGAEISPPQAPR